MPFTGKATYSAGATLPEAAEDVSDLVAINTPHETPLLDALGDPARAARSTVHEWREKRLGELSVWTPPRPGTEYIVTGDPSGGDGGDDAAMDVSEARTGVTVAEFQSNTISPTDFGYALSFVGRLYNEALVCVERNNHGGTTLAALEHPIVGGAYYRVYTDDDGKPGWNTTRQSKPIAYEELRQAIKERLHVSPSAKFAQQCRTLVRNGNASADALDGEHDDVWTAKAIGWQLRMRAGADGGRIAQPPRPARRWEGTAPTPVSAEPAKQREYRPGMGPPVRRHGW
jgi:hypothetical protein